MALDTYTNLQTAIGSWLNRADLAASIPDYITVAESQMLRRIKSALSEGKMLPRNMALKTTLTMTLSTEALIFPTDMLGGPISFYIDPQSIGGQTYGAVQLDYLSPMNFEYLKQRRGKNPSSAIPGVYTIADSTQFLLLPIPDQAYVATLWYWQKFTALSGSNASNWILANHPDAYLYGALTASAPYLREDGRTQLWSTLFQTAIEDMLKGDPLPSDRAWLRMDAGLMRRTDRASVFDITTGDYVGA